MLKDKELIQFLGEYVEVECVDGTIIRGNTIDFEWGDPDPDDGYEASLGIAPEGYDCEMDLHPSDIKFIRAIKPPWKRK